MANEIQVRSGLQIRKFDSTGTFLTTNYPARPVFFNPGMAGSAGPTPGSFLASIHGTKVDLSQLNTMGGMCQVANQDQTNAVTLGLYDTVTFEFYPFMDLLPGESYVYRLASDLTKEETTGTSTGSGTVQLMVKARVASCQVQVDCFDL